MEAATEALRDPAWGLSFASQLNMSGLDALGFLIMTSATLREAIARTLEFQHLLFAGGEGYALRIEGERAILTFECYGGPRPAHVQQAEIAMYDMAVNTNHLLDAPLMAERVRFRHARSEGVDYENWFKIPVDHEAPAKRWTGRTPEQHRAESQ